MLGTVLYAPGDVRCTYMQEQTLLHPTDAIVRLSASCVCGSDHSPYRGMNAVISGRPGQFVAGSFCLSDNTCPHCRYGFQSSSEKRAFMTGAQAQLARVPLADGTRVPTPDMPSDYLIPDLLAASDVLGTGG